VKTPREEQIQNFWKWFQSVAENLELMINRSETVQVVTLLSPKMKGLYSGTSWEVGPGLERPFALSFGLAGQLTNLTTTRAIVALAPRLANWEFFPARPPKQWQMKFTLPQLAGRGVEVDCRRWEYALTAFNDSEFFDICVMADNIENFGKAARLQAASILLEGILGEINFLRLIDHVGVITPAEIGDQARERFSNISFLTDHLMSLTTNSNQKPDCRERRRNC
jgi:hypothetical protein